MLASLHEIRAQLPSIVIDTDSDNDLYHRDVFAQNFVRLSAALAGIPRTHDIEDSYLPDEMVPSPGIHDQNPATRPAFDTRHNLYAIFLDEAKARLLQLWDWLHAASNSQDVHWESAAHAAYALAGCSATVGLSEIRQLAMAMEAIFTGMRAGDGQMAEPVQSILQKALVTLEQMHADLSSGLMPQTAPAILEQLLALSLAASDPGSDVDYPQEDDTELSLLRQQTHMPETTEGQVTFPEHQQLLLPGKDHSDPGTPPETKSPAFSASANKARDPVHD